MVDNQYLAGIPIPPGDTLQEVLDDRRMKQKELAERMGCTPKHINTVVQGKASITADFAINLEKVLGIPAKFWMNLELEYQETLARLKSIEQLDAERTFLEKIPYKEYEKLGWLPCTPIISEQINNLRSFFGVATLESVLNVQSVAFRKSAHHLAEAYALAAWITKAEQLAKEHDPDKFNAGKLKESLNDIKKMTKIPLRKSSFFKIEQLCLTFGVVVVIVPPISKTHVNGVTKWLDNDRVMVALSPRGAYEDIFWFTFFHEIGHVLQNKKSKTFVDLEHEELDVLENEADTFALETLLNKKAYQEFVHSKKYVSEGEIRSFSRQHDIHAGILVGRLMKDGIIEYGHSFNKLRQKI